MNPIAFDLSGLTPERLNEIVPPIDTAVYKDTLDKIRTITASNLADAQKWTMILRTLNTSLTTVGATLRIVAAIPEKTLLANWQGRMLELTTLGFLLGGSVVIETIFALDGLGYLAYQSISHKDFPVTQAIVLFLSVVYVLLTLVADLVVPDDDRVDHPHPLDRVLQRFSLVALEDREGFGDLVRRRLTLFARHRRRASAG